MLTDKAEVLQYAPGMQNKQVEAPLNGMKEPTRQLSPPVRPVLGQKKPGAHGVGKPTPKLQ